MIWTCKKCSSSFEPTAHQIRVKSIECGPCKNKREREYRARRKAAGNPVKEYAVDLERRNERHSKLMEDPYYRKYRSDAQKERYKDPTRKNKISTRRITNRAIEEGSLVRLTCEICSFEPAEAHHDDYDKPMNVRWLCRSHHREHHKNEKALASRSLEIVEKKP